MITLQEATNRHKEMFGVEPITVDRLRDPYDEIDAILNAIETGVPLDETKELDEDALSEYGRGALDF